MNNGLTKVMGYMLDDLYPQTCKLKLFRESIIQLNVAEIVPCENRDDEDDLRHGLSQMLTEVIEAQERFGQKVTDVFDGKAEAGKEGKVHGKASIAVDNAFGDLKVAFSRLQPILDIQENGMLQGNPESVEILADMVKTGLEYLEAGMKGLTDEYSDLKEAPEAQPESTTSEA